MFACNAVRPAFFRGDTLREGFSVTEDDRVVPVTSPEPAGPPG